MTNNDETIDAEFTVVDLPTRDYLGQIQWKTAEGRIILVKDMTDSHIRNAALFLMGMGYSKCHTPDNVRVAWLSVFRKEWERRPHNTSLKKYVVKNKILLEEFQ